MRRHQQSLLRKPPSWPSPTAGPRLWGPGSGRLSSASLSAIAAATAHATTAANRSCCGGVSDATSAASLARAASHPTLVLRPTPTGPQVSYARLDCSSTTTSSSILQPVMSRLQRRITTLEAELSASSKPASDDAIRRGLATDASVPYHPRLHGSPSTPDFVTGAGTTPPKLFSFQQGQLNRHQSHVLNEQCARGDGVVQLPADALPAAAPKAERRPYDTWQFQQYVNKPVTPASRPKLSRLQRERLEERRRAAAKMRILRWREEQERFGEEWYHDPANFRGPAQKARSSGQGTSLNRAPGYRQAPRLRPATSSADLVPR